MDINLCSKELFAKNGKKGAKMLIQGPEQLKDGIFLQFWPQIRIPRLKTPYIYKMSLKTFLCVDKKNIVCYFEERCDWYN